MDLLCDADEYKLVGNHVDVVYYNGDNPVEKEKTQQLVEKNLIKLNSNNIPAECAQRFAEEWFFISK